MSEVMHSHLHALPSPGLSAHPGTSTTGAVPSNLPSVCPVCGAYSLAPEGEMSALLAVCDVLVVKALEKLGNYIVRAERSRFRTLGTKSTTLAHTMWPAEDTLVDKALKGAWEVVPALLDVHGCCGVSSIQVTSMLDDYVHDLAITGTAHTLIGDGGLMYRFQSHLGLPVYSRSAVIPVPVVHRSVSASAPEGDRS